MFIYILSFVVTALAIKLIIGQNQLGFCKRNIIIATIQLDYGLHLALV